MAHCSRAAWRVHNSCLAALAWTISRWPISLTVVYSCWHGSNHYGISACLHLMVSQMEIKVCRRDYKLYRQLIIGRCYPYVSASWLKSCGTRITLKGMWVHMSSWKLYPWPLLNDSVVMTEPWKKKASVVRQTRSNSLPGFSIRWNHKRKSSRKHSKVRCKSQGCLKVIKHQKVTTWRWNRQSFSSLVWTCQIIHFSKSSKSCPLFHKCLFWHFWKSSMALQWKKRQYDKLMELKWQLSRSIQSNVSPSIC